MYYVLFKKKTGKDLGGEVRMREGENKRQEWKRTKEKKDRIIGDGKGGRNGNVLKQLQIVLFMLIIYHFVDRSGSPSEFSLVFDLLKYFEGCKERWSNASLIATNNRRMTERNICFQEVTESRSFDIVDCDTNIRAEWKELEI